MNASAWYMPLEPSDADQVGRMAEFKVAHPAVIIGNLGRSWQARWRDGDDMEIVKTRYRLEDLLDYLDTIFPPGSEAQPGGG